MQDSGLNKVLMKRGSLTLMRQFAAFALSNAILLVIPLAATAASPQVSRNREKWIAVADHLIQTPPESYSYDWGEATLFIGLLKTYERTHNPAYIDYVEKWAALYTTKSREEILELDATGSHRDESGEGVGPIPGDCNRWVPGVVMLSLFQERKKQDYLRMVEMITRFHPPISRAQSRRRPRPLDRKSRILGGHALHGLPAAGAVRQIGKQASVCG